MKVYYNKEFLQEVKDMDEAWSVAVNFLHGNGRKPDYYRTWRDSERNCLVMDFGSWTDFIYFYD